MLNAELHPSNHDSVRSFDRRLSIFYRDAGPKDAPAILLLHGFPSSTRMYEPLLARLSDRYHLIAPDYAGFGHSDAPDPGSFSYTFDHLAAIVDHVTQTVGLAKYTLYVQDYGGPIGFRLALAHPDRLQALIVQNAGHTKIVWAPCGPPAALSGPTGPQTRRRFVRI
jgi:pimeloyl-ACP methyl ester carboxylesterase